MLNLYVDPRGEKIFDKSNPVTGMESTSKLRSTAQPGSSHTQSEPEAEKMTSVMEEALKEKERRISELEKELSVIKVGLIIAEISRKRNYITNTQLVCRYTCPVYSFRTVCIMIVLCTMDKFLT